MLQQHTTDPAFIPLVAPRSGANAVHRKVSEYAAFDIATGLHGHHRCGPTVQAMKLSLLCTQSACLSLQQRPTPWHVWLLPVNKGTFGLMLETQASMHVA